MNSDPRKQFSKWLARSGAIYWISFLSALLLLIYLRPDVANACVYLAVIVSVVMIIHVWAYTRNSVYEKGLLAMLDRTKMQLSLGKSGAECGNKADAEGDGDNTDEAGTEGGEG